MKPVTTEDIVMELQNLRTPIQDRTVKNWAEVTRATLLYVQTI